MSQTFLIYKVFLKLNLGKEMTDYNSPSSSEKQAEFIFLFFFVDCVGKNSPYQSLACKTKKPF